MPKETFYLDEKRNQVLECSWGFNWQNFTVKLNNQDIGLISGRRELLNGKEFEIGKDIISIKLDYISGNFKIKLNGKLLSHKSNKTKLMDPLKIIRNAYYAALILSGINIIFGILVASMVNSGLGIGVIVAGIVFMILAFGIKEKRIWAAWIAVILIIYDFISTLIAFIDVQSAVIVISGIFVKFIFVITFIRALTALIRLRKTNLSGNTE